MYSYFNVLDDVGDWPEPCCGPVGMYTVRPGDKLSAIAQRYGVPLAKLIAANPQLKKLVAGQALAIPGQRDGFDARPILSTQPGTALQRGATGAAVVSLQRRLVARGFLTAAAFASGPGVYGPRTEAAVRSFQAARRLPVTGVAGAQTVGALAADTFQASRRPDFGDEVTAPMGAPVGEAFAF